MNLFQWITIPILGLLFAADLRGMLFKRPFFRRDRMIRCVIWLAAGLAIYDPAITIIAANSIGIQRGADLITYIFALSFLATSFYFYSRSIRIERQITELIRHIALNEARTNGAPGESGQNDAPSN
jgi:hypothetical protein